MIDLKMSQAGTRECNLASSVAFLEDNDDVSYSRSSWSYLCYAKHPAPRRPPKVPVACAWVGLMKSHSFKDTRLDTTDHDSAKIFPQLQLSKTAKMHLLFLDLCSLQQTNRSSPEDQEVQ